MIKHEIRSPDGGTRTVNLTPIKAIRLFCLECMGWSAYEVKDCVSELCTLHSYRFGKIPGHKGKGNVQSLVNLKEKAVD